VRTELTVRPVVAVLDIGCGNHPWLTGDPNVAGSHGVVTRDGQDPDGGVAERIGLPTQPDPEDTGDLTGPLDGIIDAVSGHGTFICGLVHQICPDADLLSIRVIHSDGRACCSASPFTRPSGAAWTRVSRCSTRQMRCPTCRDRCADWSPASAGC
jgi:hypothetical protein